MSAPRPAMLGVACGQVNGWPGPPVSRLSSLKPKRLSAILRLMFSEAVLDHFRNPRNAGELAEATARVQVANPVCGDILELAVRMESGRIVAARFRTRGCVTAIAASSLLTELLIGKTLAEARRISAKEISELLGGLPPATTHGSQLACDAIEALAAQVEAPSGRGRSGNWPPGPA
jgi:nitrogen fixation protein NifU and related proteins